MTDLSHMLGKGFRPGARGPMHYDCLGVAAEVVRQIVGGEAADALPGGTDWRVDDDGVPNGWFFMGTSPWMAKPGNVILTQRRNGDGHVSHHVYGVTTDGKLASAEIPRGVCVVPRRGIVGEVVGVYEWRGAR